MANESTTRAVLTHGGKVLIEQSDGSYREAKSQTDWERLDRLSDCEIEEAAANDPDAAPLDDSFWATASAVFSQHIPKGRRG